MRRFGATAVAAVMLAMGVTSQAAADSWAPQTPDGSIGFGFTDTFGGNGPVSVVLAEKDAAVAINMRGDGTPADMSGDLLCDSYATAPCNDPATGFNMRIVLPPCDATITEWCIAGLEVGRGSLTSAQLLRSTSGRTYAADPVRGLPAAGSVSLWRGGVQHRGGTDTYAVTVMLDAGKLSTAKELWVYGLTASVTPYTETTDGLFRATRVRQVPGRAWPIEYYSDGNNCVWIEDGRCGRRQDFDSDTRAKLQLKLGSSITGWLNGRLSDPSIEISSAGAGQNLVSVTGTMVSVPQIHVALTPAQVQELIAKAPGQFRPDGGGSRADDWPSTSRQLPILTPYLNDTASGLLTQWSFATTGSRTTDACLKDTTRLVGLVTSNAAIYESGAPSFADGFLQYRVGGLHYLPDRTLATGIYDLYLRSDAARCLYKFTNAPVSATVSVTTSDGVVNNATTVLREENGWLHLQAAGFTFSTNTIKIKFTGTATATSGTPKKTVVISCKKGSVVKKVKTKTCPAGYKKIR